MKEIHLSPPHICGEERKFIDLAFNSNWIAPLGENVDRFEEETAARVGRKYAVATSAGTHALHLALLLVGITPGDVVLCSDLTFAGSCFPICYEKATPAFVGCEDNSLNMSPTFLKQALENSRPKAVIVVDLYGEAANYQEIVPLCAEYGVPIIEDAAEAIGASRYGKPCGSFGELSVFSFNGNKLVTTGGGGMLVTDSSTARDKAKFLATQAKEPAPYYLHKEVGYNYRLSNVSAGIGRGQLLCLDRKLAKKREIFRYYKDNLSGYGYEFAEDLGEPNHWLSVCMTETPDAGIAALAKEHIEARRLWKPMHEQPVFSSCRFFGDDRDSCLFTRGLCLPSDTQMSDRDLERVVSVLKRCRGSV